MAEEKRDVTCPNHSSKPIIPSTSPFLTLSTLCVLASSFAAGRCARKRAQDKSWISLNILCFVKRIVTSGPRSSLLASWALRRKVCYVRRPETDSATLAPQHMATLPVRDCFSLSLSLELLQLPTSSLIQSVTLSCFCYHHAQLARLKIFVHTGKPLSRQVTSEAAQSSLPAQTVQRPHSPDLLQITHVLSLSPGSLGQNI